MTQQLNLTLSELATVKSDFAAKYQAANPGLSFPWNIRLNWHALVAAVEGSITWSAEETVLRFIHRFDDNGWFLTMECCHVTGSGILDLFGARFDLRDGQPPAASAFTGLLDQHYFDNVYYNDEPLVTGTHVSHLKFPWSQEFKETAGLNGVLESGATDITLSSLTFDFGEDPTEVNVRWPHTLAFYYSEGATDLLDDVNDGGSLFIRNKAYDFADPCPTNCSNVYTWPF